MSLRVAITAQVLYFLLLKQPVLYFHQFKACYTSRQTHFQSDWRAEETNLQLSWFSPQFSPLSAMWYQVTAINWAKCQSRKCSRQAWWTGTAQGLQRVLQRAVAIPNTRQCFKTQEDFFFQVTNLLSCNLATNWSLSFTGQDVHDAVISDFSALKT